MLYTAGIQGWARGPDSGPVSEAGSRSMNKPVFQVQLAPLGSMDFFSQSAARARPHTVPAHSPWWVVEMMLGCVVERVTSLGVFVFDLNFGLGDQMSHLTTSKCDGQHGSEQNTCCTRTFVQRHTVALTQSCLVTELKQRMFVSGTMTHVGNGWSTTAAAVRLSCSMSVAVKSFGCKDVSQFCRCVERICVCA